MSHKSEYDIYLHLYQSSKTTFQLKSYIMHNNDIPISQVCRQYRGVWWRCDSDTIEYIRIIVLGVIRTLYGKGWHINSSPVVPHICVSKSGQHWFRQWLVVYSAPSHYLNQIRKYGVTVSYTLWNKLQWNLNQNATFLITKMLLKISAAKWPPFCPGWDESSGLLTLWSPNSQLELVITPRDSISPN